MNERFARLIALQKLDEELAALEARHAAIPARRIADAGARAEAEARLAAAREAQRAAELAQRQAERELQEREATRAKLEGQQHQVKTNEAYTALLREIDHARDAISACETRILEAMEAVGAGAAALAAAERDSQAATERAASSGRELDAQERELGARIAALRERRAGARAEIDGELAILYERVASRRHPTVVVVASARCTGCRLDIPPQRYIELLRREAIVTCGHCQRILVAADAPESTGPGR